MRSDHPCYGAGLRQTCPDDDLPSSSKSTRDAAAASWAVSPALIGAIFTPIFWPAMSIWSSCCIALVASAAEVYLKNSSTVSHGTVRDSSDCLAPSLNQAKKAETSCVLDEVCIWWPNNLSKFPIASGKSLLYGAEPLEMHDSSSRTILFYCFLPVMAENKTYWTKP